MKAEEIFGVWAPDGARWSPWVKPVLFAFMPVDDGDTLLQDLPALPSWLPAPGATALVLDLPDDDSVRYGTVLAQNRVSAGAGVHWGAWTRVERVDPGGRLAAATLAAAGHLVGRSRSGPTPRTAAFLLHAPRRAATVSLDPGCFDNRSVVLTTDFPSATTLHGHGIEQVLLLQLHRRLYVESDVSHVLRHWQEAGIVILGARLDEATGPAHLPVSKPSAFGLAWYRVLEVFGLRRHVLGGFGGEIPEPGSGGG